MAKRSIVKLPDPKLRLVSEPIGEITDEVRSLARDMLDSMYEARGIGLAAVQVGVPLFPKSLGGRPKSEWVRLMSMEHEPGKIAPVKTSLEPGTTLTAPRVVQTPYNQFPKFYEEWPYDWRADLRFNAGRLLEELRERARGGSPRASLIGHSQGALLVVLASKRADPGEFARLGRRA